MAESRFKGPSTRVDEVGHSGIYPASGPLPPTDAPLRTQGELGHPPQQRLLRGRRRIKRPSDSMLQMIGRAIFGGYFLYNGINHFRNRQMLSGYARSKQVPAADLAVLFSGAMLLAGGFSLITGVRPKLGSTLVATFLLGVSPIMHAFWRSEDDQERAQEFVNFTKNLALLGAASLAASHPQPWPASLPAAR